MDRINQLIEQLESTANELRDEYFKLWDTDADLKEALDLLEHSADYGYGHHGLFKYVQMELELDEYAEDAFEDWLDQQGIQVDNRKSRIFKRVSNYLAMITTNENTGSIVSKVDGSETTLSFEDHYDGEEDMLEHLAEVNVSNNHDLVVIIDEWNNVRVVGKNNVEYAS